MHISSFFSDCLGAAPTFDVDFNIYCSLALRRGFANPQFEEEGKTKVGCKQGRTWKGETFDADCACFDIFVFS